MKILVVCTGNTCRSPMAEGILRDLGNKNNLDIRVKSAGIMALDGDGVSKNSVITLKDLGIDIEGHKASLLRKDLVDEADIILTMTNSHKEKLIRKFPNARNKLFLYNEYAYGKYTDISDPFGGNINTYQSTRDEIYKASEAIIERLVKN